MRFLAEFPAGSAGIGLLMLRAASVFLLFGPLFPPHPPAGPLGVALALLAASLALGALTRLAAGLCAIAIAVVGAPLGDHQSLVVAAGAAMSLGLALLGPAPIRWMRVCSGAASST